MIINEGLLQPTIEPLPNSDHNIEFCQTELNQYDFKITKRMFLLNKL